MNQTIKFLFLVFSPIIIAQNLDWKAHDVGNIYDVVTNTWCQGDVAGGGAMGLPSNTFFFPKGSETTYQSSVDASGIEPTIAARKYSPDGNVSVTSSGPFSCNEVYPSTADWDTIWHVQRGEIVDIPYWPGYEGLSDQDFVRRASDYNLDPFGSGYMQQCQGDDDPHINPLFIDVITTSHAWANPPLDEFIVWQNYIIPTQDDLYDIYFGWFYVITKPLAYLLNFFSSYLGNVGLAIIALTICIRIILFPLANKSFKSMSKMKVLQPKMMEIRERYGNDKVQMQKEVMALYKKEKANPLAGCLPILLQIPVFFALYKVLTVTLEMRQAPFYGWIKDLSVPDPYSIFNSFGLIPIDLPSFLIIGIWPLLMGATMFLQQKLNPAPPDPVQAKVMAMLPFIFIFLFAQFAAGLVLYWTCNNVLSIAQQWIIMRKLDNEKQTKT